MPFPPWRISSITLRIRRGPEPERLHGSRRLSACRQRGTVVRTPSFSQTDVLDEEEGEAPECDRYELGDVQEDRERQGVVQRHVEEPERGIGGGLDHPNEAGARRKAHPQAQERQG